jgi:hypothetical protein
MRRWGDRTPGNWAKSAGPDAIECRSLPRFASAALGRVRHLIKNAQYLSRSMLTALPAGSFYTEPARATHFVATHDAGTIVQLTGTGPITASYVDSGVAPKE